MSEEKTNIVDESTNVSQVDVNLDELFGMPGAESITIPAEEEKASNVLSNKKTDMSFLDDEDSKKDLDDSDDSSKNEDDDKSSKEEQDESKDSLEDILKEVENSEEEDDDGEQEAPKKRGRKKIEGVSDVFTKLIDDDLLIPFDDDKPIEEYTAKDFQELIEANIQERERKIREATPQEFFESLPEELQYAAKYVAEGGTDLKGLFSSLAQVEQVRELNPEVEADQEAIVKQYLSATGFGDAEEIQEEIDSYKDIGRLEQLANKFKPKLDKMQERIVQQQVAEAEERKARQAEAANKYMDNVYNTLKAGEIKGLKLDKKTQASLYQGLVEPNYQSVSGRPTNLLGHLLEKYQYVEPDHELIAEALWLLSDRESYHSKIQEGAKKEAVEKTVRQLKTEQSKRQSSTVVEEKETRKSKGIPRPTNIFKRF
jgi:hypothetical protein